MLDIFNLENDDRTILGTGDSYFDESLEDIEQPLFRLVFNRRQQRWIPLGI